ncbi:MAG: hypothetical protein C4551_04520 [Bacillota bacterium]|nr:MAG: hypothetical protein C4551_04520 [Bacillota bacterium]
MPPEVHVFIVAMIPVIELRGAIPLGVHLGLPPLEALAIALAGNLAPIPLVYFILLPAVGLLKRTRLFRRLVTDYVARSEKTSERIKKYGLLGLSVFVAIPLPGTGAWTGCLIALLLGYSLRVTLLALTLGTLVAGTAVAMLAKLATG